MPKPKLKSPNEYREELRGRLQKLHDRFEQIEIARRTGVPPANVHRYLKAGRIPAEFCLALSDAFDLSPDWLIRGEGQPVTSDVRAETSAKAGELLDLVKAMNAVARLRLGAVVGDRDRKTVRELADTLETYDRLREKMNDRSRPVLNSLLDDLGEALGKMDMPRARTLRETAVELSRLCTDDAIHERLDRLQAGTEYLTGHTDEALEFYRKVFARRVRDGLIDDPANLNTCAHFVLQLRETGRMRETIRVAGAILSLTPIELAEDPSLLTIKVFHASSLMETGTLDDALPVLRKAHAKLTGQGKLIAETMLMRGLMLAGVLDYQAACGFGSASRPRARLLVRYACFNEDESTLSHAVTNLIGDDESRIPQNEFDAQLAQLLLKVLQGRKAGVRDYEQFVAKHPPVAAGALMKNLIVSTHGAQVARLARDKRAATKWTKQTSDVLARLPDEFEPRIDIRVIHLRNLKAAQKAKGKHPVEASMLESELTNWTLDGYHGLTAKLGEP